MSDLPALLRDYADDDAVGLSIDFPNGVTLMKQAAAEIERLRAALKPAAESVLAEFDEALTRQQRDYIVDQIVRRAFTPPACR